MLFWLTNNSGGDSSSRANGKGFYYGWVVVIASLVIATVSFGIRFSFGVFFKPLQTDLVLNRTLTSAIVSIYMLLGCVFSVLGGWALDRYGPRKVIALLGLITGLSLLSTAHASALWHLFISYSLLLAMGTGAIYTIGISTASRWFIKRRGLAAAVVTSAIGVGMMVVAPISAYLISSYGWRMSYTILGLVAFFVITPFALLLKKAPGDVSSLPGGEISETTNLYSAEKQISSEPQGFTLPQAVKTRNFWAQFFMWLAGGINLYIIAAHIVPHAIDLGIAPTDAAFIISLIGGVSILGRLVMGRISDSIGRKQIAVISTLFMAGAMLWLVWASELWMFYLFAVVFGFFFGGINATVVALVADVFGLRYLGIITGVLDAGFGIGAALGATLAGYIFDVRGNYTFAFLAGMLALIVQIGLIILLKVPEVSTGDEVTW